MEVRSRILISIAGTIVGAGLFLLVVLLVGEHPVTYVVPGFLGGIGLAVCEVFSDHKNLPSPITYAIFGLISLLLGLMLTYLLIPIQVTGHLGTMAPAIEFMSLFDYLIRKASLMGIIALAIGVITSWNLPNHIHLE